MAVSNTNMNGTRNMGKANVRYQVCTDILEWQPQPGTLLIKCVRPRVIRKITERRKRSGL